MTRGGPTDSSTTFATWSYRLSFGNLLPQFGPGAAVGNLLIIMAFLAGLTYIRWTIAGQFTLAEWGAWLPECFWPVWGAALATATVSYRRRRNHDEHQADLRMRTLS